MERIKERIKVFFGGLGVQPISVTMDAGTNFGDFLRLRRVKKFVTDNEFYINRRRARANLRLRDGDVIVGVPRKVITCPGCSNCQPDRYPKK